ncbi:hypothetical protein ACLOJK_016304 [Asimina triloba]
MVSQAATAILLGYSHLAQLTYHQTLRPHKGRQACYHFGPIIFLAAVSHVGACGCGLLVFTPSVFGCRGLGGTGPPQKRAGLRDMWAHVFALGPPLQSPSSRSWLLVLGLASYVLQIHGYTTALAAAFLHLLLARAVTQPTSSPSGWGLDDDEKMRLGSTPPSCHGRCSECNPCLAVQVPTLPDHDDVGQGSGNSVATALVSSSAASSIGDPYSNYKPLEWKCRCGDHDRRSCRPQFSIFKINKGTASHVLKPSRECIMGSKSPRFFPFRQQPHKPFSEIELQMASSSASLLLPSPLSHNISPLLPKLPSASSQIAFPITSSFHRKLLHVHLKPLPAKSFSVSASVSASSKTPSSPLHALIFDCDGVILESEHLHRTAYNDAFKHFDVRCPPSAPQPLNWDLEFYDELQNRIGGGKPKMRWTGKQKADAMIRLSPDPVPSKANTVPPGTKLAVCSAATKSSVVLCLENLIGTDRFQGLDCFLAGDDVKEKKPDPSIYLTALKRLGLQSQNCLVVEDSVIGLQDFKDAIALYPDLSNVTLEDLELLLQRAVPAK